ncbi:MAG TPA: hypothetical protein VHX66_13945 [Solirubrobacteraceae bacterium]|jgi:hypothetical protein|nr:hypothetical protein [Solirubrobacteraceae bacterium]
MIKEPEDSMSWQFGVGFGTNTRTARRHRFTRRVGTTCQFQVTASFYTGSV